MTPNAKRPIIRVRMPRLHAAQTDIRKSATRFAVINAGRRFGKTILCVSLALRVAAAGGRVWWLAPSYSVGSIAFRAAWRLAERIPGTTRNRADRLIEFASGGSVQIRTVDDPDLLRGESLDLCIFDEAAFMPRLQELFEDVIRPSLSDREGRAVFISTPKGRNYFWHLFNRGHDDNHPDWISFHRTSYDNPHIQNSEIDAMRSTMPDLKFRQEILAEFIDGAGVFNGIRAASTATLEEVATPGHTYTAGIDWGRTSDATALVIVNATAQSVCHVRRWVNVPFREQLRGIVETLALFEPDHTIVERNSMGLSLFEQLVDMEPATELGSHHMSNQSKSDFVDMAVLALEQDELTLLDDPVFTHEMEAYTASSTRTGLTRYHHPPGGHDDTVDAFLLAWAAACDHADLLPEAEEPPPEPILSVKSHSTQDVIKLRYGDFVGVGGDTRGTSRSVSDLRDYYR